MQRLKKADILLIAAVTVVSAALFFGGIIYYSFFRSYEGATENAGKQEMVEILVDGKCIGQYDLCSDGEYEIITPYGRNLLVISDGAAKITEADCTGGDCTQMKAISKSGEMIVCLPHRLAVTIVSGEKSEIDVMVH